MTVHNGVNERQETEPLGRLAVTCVNRELLSMGVVLRGLARSQV